MGEHAEMRLDGTLCEQCGEFIGGTAFDVPLLCKRCATELGREGAVIQRLGKHYQNVTPVSPAAKRAAARPAVVDKVACPICLRRVKAVGLVQHQHDAHPLVPFDAPK